MRPFFFPQIDGYPVYDDALYTAMSNDELRTRRLTAAINALAYGKVVADIGTGRDVNWARAAIAAGAARAYAIELSSSAFALAKQTVQRLGLEDRIVLIQGDSLLVELPEKVDLIVSEIIGQIGSAEGQLALMQNARRRFLKPEGLMIPGRCVTRVAAATLPSALYEEPRMSPHGETYATRIFEFVGRPFDLRLGIPNFDPQDILSTGGIFEELNFNAPVPQQLEYTNETVLTIERSGRMDGLILWIELYCGNGDDALNSLRESIAWHPAFFPVFYPGVEVAAGDELRLRCQVTLSDDGLHPDYRVTGTLCQKTAVSPFIFSSLFRGNTHRGNAFYRKLFQESVDGMGAAV